MLEWNDDLKLTGCELYLDAKRPRALSFVSHGHSDHIALHQHAIASPVTAEFMRYRIGESDVTRLEFDQPYVVEDSPERLRIELRPAGHVLGSAMIHIRRDDGQSLLYTGDFKLRESRTCETANVIEADCLVMESTYGLPMFRFPSARLVAEELVELCATSLRDGRQPIVMGYSLGKSQEISRILTDGGLPVTQHGACFAMTEIYERFGQRIGATIGSIRRYRYEDFHGEHPIDLQQRGVLVAPPSCARSSFVTRFDNPLTIVCTGWALIKGAQFRYGVDHALPLSDHADFDELLELIERVKPKRIYTHHGYPQFAERLKSMGLDARLARPDPQLSLFVD